MPLLTRFQEIPWLLPSVVIDVTLFASSYYISVLQLCNWHIPIFSRIYIDVPPFYSVMLTIEVLYFFLLIH